MSNFARALVKRRIVARFVDARAPDDDRGMVAIAADHGFDVADGKVLPAFVADVLPARWLLPDHQAELVARIEKRFGLGIMGAADEVAVELMTENLGIAAQKAWRRSKPE